MFLQTHTSITVLIIMLKNLNLKLVITSGFQNIRMLLQEVTLQIGLKKFLVFRIMKVKNSVSNLPKNGFCGRNFENLRILLLEVTL